MQKPGSPLRRPMDIVDLPSSALDCGRDGGAQCPWGPLRPRGAGHWAIHAVVPLVAVLPKVQVVQGVRHSHVQGRSGHCEVCVEGVGGTLV